MFVAYSSLRIDIQVEKQSSFCKESCRKSHVKEVKGLLWLDAHCKASVELPVYGNERSDLANAFLNSLTC